LKDDETDLEGIPSRNNYSKAILKRKMRKTNPKEVSLGLLANQAMKKYERSAVILGLKPKDRRTSLADFAKE